MMNNVVIEQLILFYKPNKNLTEIMINDFIPQIKRHHSSFYRTFALEEEPPRVVR